jgi:hypothetical protein
MEARNGSGFSYFYLFFFFFFYLLLLFLWFTLLYKVYGNLNYINKVIILSSDHKVKDEVEKVVWDN